MTTLLQSYEEEYRDTVKSINDEVAALRASLNRDAPGYKAPPATGQGSRVQRCAAISNLLSQIKDLLGSMDYECNDLPAANRQVAKDRVSEYRTSTKKLEESLAKLRIESSAADRQDLLSSAAKKTDAASAAAGGEPGQGELDDETRKQRLQMMDNTDKFKQASSTLNKAERLLNETETVGNEALTNLRAQTEQMQRINETTIAVDDEVSEARKILGGMQRVMIKHKLMLIAIILVLILLIIVAIYVSVSKGRSQGNVTPTQTPVNPITPPPSLNPGGGGLPQW